VAEGFGSLSHLAGRFAGALWPGGPPAEGERWAQSWLGPGEVRLWRSMSGPDRRHALGVGRQVAADLGVADAPAAGDARQEDAEGRPTTRAVVAAALLHDVGKIDAGIGTWARAVVTAIALVVGRDRVASWARAGRSPRARAGRYVTHDRLGRGLLEDAGSDPFTVTWAGEHHIPAARQVTDRRLAGMLTAADGD
jgi:hypothetical protein